MEYVLYIVGTNLHSEYPNFYSEAEPPPQKSRALNWNCIRFSSNNLIDPIAELKTLFLCFEVL